MSKHGLPRRMKDLLLFLGSHVKEFGHGPTTSEIQRHFGWRSRTSVVQVMRQLFREGLVQRIEDSKLRYKRLPNLPRTTSNFVRIPLLKIHDGMSFEAATKAPDRFWIDRRMYGVSLRRAPFLVQFSKPPGNPFGIRATHALLVSPLKELKTGGRSWILATIGGRIGVYRSVRTAGYLMLENCRDKGLEAFELPQAQIHGKIIAALFVEPHRGKEGKRP